MGRTSGAQHWQWQGTHRWSSVNSKSASVSVETSRPLYACPSNASTACGHKRVRCQVRLALPAPRCEIRAEGDGVRRGEGMRLAAVCGRGSAAAHHLAGVCARGGGGPTERAQALLRAHTCFSGSASNVLKRCTFSL